MVLRTKHRTRRMERSERFTYIFIGSVVEIHVCNFVGSTSGTLAHLALSLGGVAKSVSSCRFPLHSLEQTTNLYGRMSTELV